MSEKTLLYVMRAVDKKAKLFREILMKIKALKPSKTLSKEDVNLMQLVQSDPSKFEAVLELEKLIDQYNKMCNFNVPYMFNYAFLVPKDLNSKLTLDYLLNNEKVEDLLNGKLI